MPNFKAVGQHLKDYAFVYPSVTATGSLLYNAANPARQREMVTAVNKGLSSTLADYALPEQVKTRLSNTVDQTQTAVADKVSDAIVDSGKSAVNNGVKWVKNNPWQTAGLAGLAVGVPVLAKILSDSWDERNDEGKALERARKRLEAAQLNAQARQLKVAGFKFKMPSLAPPTTPAGRASLLTTANTLGLVTGVGVPITYAGIKTHKAFNSPESVTNKLLMKPDELVADVTPKITDKVLEKVREYTTPEKVREMSQEAVGGAIKGLIQQPIDAPAKFAAGLAVTVLGSVLAKRLYDRWGTSATDKRQKELLKQLDAKVAFDLRGLVRRIKPDSAWTPIGGVLGTAPVVLNSLPAFAADNGVTDSLAAGYERTPATGLAMPIIGALAGKYGSRYGRRAIGPLGKGAGLAGMGVGIYAGVDPAGAGKLIGNVGGKAAVGVIDAEPSLSALMNKTPVPRLQDVIDDRIKQLEVGLKKAPDAAYKQTRSTMDDLTSTIGTRLNDNKWLYAGGIAAMGVAPILLYHLLNSKSKSALTDKLIDKTEARRKRLEA